MEELDKALDGALAATLELKNLTQQHDFTGEGIFHVKAKSLAQYQTSLLDVIQAKFEKKSLATVEDSIFETCTQRTILERIRPLELKLQPKIDKMIKIQEEGISKSDPLNFKPSLKDLEDSDEDESEAKSEPGSEDEDLGSEIEDDTEEKDSSAKAGKYVPPKLNSVPYPGEYEPRNKEKLAAEEEKAKERALKSSQMREMQITFGDDPVEHKDDITKAKAVSSKSIREMEKRRLYEEDNYKRISVTKKQRKAEERALTRDDMEAIDVMGDISMLDGAGAKRFMESRQKGKKRGGAGKRNNQSNDLANFTLKSKKKRRK